MQLSRRIQAQKATALNFIDFIDFPIGHIPSFVKVAQFFWFAKIQNSLWEKFGAPVVGGAGKWPGGRVTSYFFSTGHFPYSFILFEFLKIHVELPRQKLCRISAKSCQTFMSRPTNQISQFVPICSCPDLSRPIQWLSRNPGSVQWLSKKRKW